MLCAALVTAAAVGLHPSVRLARRFLEQHVPADILADETSAAKAAEQERRERRAARTRPLRAAAGVLRPAPAVGRATGVLERRRRQQNGLLVALLLVLVIVVWVVRPDWAARLGIVVLVVLAFPVLRLLLFSRR